MSARRPTRGGRSTAVRWGFHRLDESWAARLATLVDARRGDLVIDVGAGDGVVTEALLATGASVLAIELHPARAAALRERFAGARVRVVQADAADLRLPRRPFKVAANPPFDISTPLLQRLTGRGSRLECAALVLPRPAVASWTGRRGTSAHRAGFQLACGANVPASAFRPAPPRSPQLLLIGRVGAGDVRGIAR